MTLDQSLSPMVLSQSLCKPTVWLEDRLEREEPWKVTGQMQRDVTEEAQTGQSAHVGRDG